MSWVYRKTYVGPDRRTDQFQVRFIERRREQEAGGRGEIYASLQQLFARGMRWVDVSRYFGPDRRGDDYSFFFLERRRDNAASPPPPLATALRQLRMRLTDLDDATSRHLVRERIIATAMLADAQDHIPIGDMLMDLAAALDQRPEQGDDPRLMLQAALNRIEARLADGARR